MCDVCVCEHTQDSEAVWDHVCVSTALLWNTASEIRAGMSMHAIMMLLSLPSRLTRADEGPVFRNGPQSSDRMFYCSLLLSGGLHSDADMLRSFCFVWGSFWVFMVEIEICGTSLIFSQVRGHVACPASEKSQSWQEWLQKYAALRSFN